MSAPVLELEGTWEEILEHAPELKGMHVTLKAVPEEPRNADGDRPLSEKQRRMLATIQMLRDGELTPEEIEILDGTEEFRKRNPFNLRRPRMDRLDWTDIKERSGSRIQTSSTISCELDQTCLTGTSCL
jgi:hypothetical protein